MFKTLLRIPAGTALNQPVCIESQQLGIVDDEIVEGPQSFSVMSVEVSPAGTATLSNTLIVTIEDNDCECINDIDLSTLHKSLYKYACIL